ncbi:hypothetical protein [Nakamurella aerolata]|uniref:Major tail protein n=1 Tax=Nakamurella aerolata TaxID=1656892 RepID=A0A849A8T2_9ACTN|nr:hypothetical protein [Nakamurella aerolata]NNG36945.1 hypothetical protein [Nakamurella aerolata]
MTSPTPTTTSQHTLVNGNRRIVWVETLADPAHPKLSEIAAGKDLSCDIVKGNVDVGMQESDTNDESPLCQTANGKSITAANYQATFTTFRLYTPEGLPAEDDPVVLLGDQPHGYILDFQGKPVLTSSVKAGDPVAVYGGQLDYPRPNAAEGKFKSDWTVVPSGEVFPNATVAA